MTQAITPAKNLLLNVLPTHRRNLYRISLVSTILVPFLGIVLFQPLRSINPGGVFIFIVFVISAAGTAVMSRRWASYWISVYYLLSILILLLALPFVSSIPGILLAALGCLTVVGIAPLILPVSWIPWSLLGAVIFAGSTLIVDQFAQSSQKISQFNLVACYIVIGLLLLFIFSKSSMFSMSTKVIVALLGVTVLIAVILYNFSTNSATNFYQDTVGEQLHSLTQLKALSVGGIVGRQVDGLGILALNEVLRAELGIANSKYSMDTREQQELIEQLEAMWQKNLNNEGGQQDLISETLSSPVSLELIKYMKEFPNVIELLVVDRYGALMGATNEVTKFSQKSQAWWQIALNNGQGSTYLSLPERDPLSGFYTMEVAIPIRDRVTLEVAGVLKAKYDVSELEPILFDVKVGENDKAALIFPGSIGSAISESNDLPINQLTISEIRSVSDQHFADLDLAGRRFLISQTPVFSSTGNSNVNRLVDNLGWVVVLAQPMEDVLASVDQNSRNAIILAVAIIILSVFSGLWVTNIIISPILRLRLVTEKFSEGILSAQALEDTEDETGKLANQFNEMADQLQATLQHLEKRVEERTRVIELSSDIGRRLSTILDTDTLFAEVVELLQFAFDYYFVQIFELNKDRLVMVGGTGEAGSVLLGRNHSLLLGQGLVGQAAKTGTFILVQDIQKDRRHLGNPLLPETISELATPILIGEKVIGVLDVQHNVPGILNDDHVDLLATIANQIASAMQNANMYETARKRAEAESKMNEIVIRIQNSSTIEEAIQTAAIEIGRFVTSKTSVELKLARGSDGQRVAGD